MTGKVVPIRAEHWVKNPAPLDSTPSSPSLAQVAMLYRQNLERISEEMAKHPHPSDLRSNRNAEWRALKLTMELLSVTKGRVLDAVRAEREAGIEAFQAFREPQKLKVETLGIEVSPSFAARLDRVIASIKAAQRGPSKTLRALCDMLAFNMPVDPEKVREAIELCEKLLSILGSMKPIALCTACRCGSGIHTSGTASCSTCSGVGYLTVSLSASLSETELPLEGDREEA